MFSRFSFRSLFRRIREIFIPDEDFEELEIEDEEDEHLARLNELEQREQELQKRIDELERREAELDEPPIETPEQPQDTKTDTELDELEAELDKLESNIEEAEQSDTSFSSEELEILDAYGFISDEELQFRSDMADFFGVPVTDLVDISIEDLEVISRSIIFDSDRTGEYVGSFSTISDLTNSPLFDIIIDGYGDLIIDNDGNISVFQTGTDRQL